MKQDVKIMLGIGIVCVVLLVGAAFLMGGSATPNQTQKVDPKLLVRQNSHTTNGSPKVTIVEFGDYQCPACGVAHPVMKEIESEYGNKITFVFRNFPLPMHQNSHISAEAAEAAGKQGKFWQMYDLLYQNQKEWSESTSPLDIFATYAKKLGLDVEQFKSDVSNNAYAKQIEQDIKDGNALGVNATPTFFINGVMMEGVPQTSDFKEKINQALVK